MDQGKQLDVIILVDNFSPELSPLTNNKAWGFNRFPVFNFIDLCLDWVIRLKSPNVVVAIANQSQDEAEKLYQRWSSNIQNIKVMNMNDCQSANDILRELQHRGVFTRDFLLIHNCATVCSSNLATQIENFRARKRQNKNMVATLLFTEEKNLSGENIEDIQRHPLALLGYETTSEKLIYYDNTSNNNRKIQIPKKFFLDETTFRMDLLSAGIWLCGMEFASHFSGNHDFNSLEDILLDILVNEEILGQQIHIEIVKDMKILSIRTVKAGNSLNSDQDEEETDDDDVQSNNKKEWTEPVDMIYQGNNQAFVVEVWESMQAILKDSEAENENKPVEQYQIPDEEIETLKLEINASKLAYNIGMEDLPRLLFFTFLRLTKMDQTQRLETFKKFFLQLSSFWSVYFKRTAAKISILHAIEEFALEHEHFRRNVPSVLLWLNQDQEFIDEHQIINWHSTLTSNSPLYKLPKLEQFILWLQQDEDEED